MTVCGNAGVFAGLVFFFRIEGVFQRGGCTRQRAHARCGAHACAKGLFQAAFGVGRAGWDVFAAAAVIQFVAFGQQRVAAFDQAHACGGEPACAGAFA